MLPVIRRLIEDKLFRYSHFPAYETHANWRCSACEVRFNPTHCGMTVVHVPNAMWEATLCPKCGSVYREAVEKEQLYAQLTAASGAETDNTGD